jgi:hypothetical protein
MRWRWLVIGAIVVSQTAGCGGGTPNTPTPTPPPTPAVLQVAGTYQITQAAVSDTCGQTGTPAAVTGTVTHAPGAGTFSLADTGGTTFSGTVQNTGDFTSTATFGPDAGGNTYMQRLAGRFTATGFSGQLDVDVSPRNCRFTRTWSAVKQGAPNTFP